MADKKTMPFSTGIVVGALLGFILGFSASSWFENQQRSLFRELYFPTHAAAMKGDGPAATGWLDESFPRTAEWPEDYHYWVCGDSSSTALAINPTNGQGWYYRGSAKK